MATTHSNLTIRSPTDIRSLWNEYSDKGIDYYYECYDKQGDDMPFPSELDEELKTKWGRERNSYYNFPEEVKTLLDRMRYSTSQSRFSYIDSTWPKNPPDGRYTARFYSWASAKQGLFVVEYENKKIRWSRDGTMLTGDDTSEGQGESAGSGSPTSDAGRNSGERGQSGGGTNQHEPESKGPEMIDSDGESPGGQVPDDDEPMGDAPDTSGEGFKWYFSQVAWWQWVYLCKKQKHYRYSDLKLFWVSNIYEPTTVKLLDDLFKGTEHVPDVTMFFKPGDKKNEDAFWALLGSPIGSGIIHMLTENKNALGNKNVASISVNGEGHGDGKVYTLWADLKAVTSDMDGSGQG